MKNNVIFDFERYTAPAIYFAIFLILVGTFFAILIREAKEQNSNWSAPVWFANIVILVFSCFPGSIVVRIIEVSADLSIPAGPWNIIPAAVLGWFTIAIMHSVFRKVGPITLRSVALKLFS